MLNPTSTFAINTTGGKQRLFIYFICILCYTEMLAFLAILHAIRVEIVHVCAVCMYVPEVSFFILLKQKLSCKV